MNKIKVGDLIPDFSLYNQDGNLLAIQDHIGQPMVIYFYPKDDTHGCSHEACAFRDAFQDFKDLDVKNFWDQQ